MAVASLAGAEPGEVEDEQRASPQLLYTIKRQI
jgi:hypothetical protein